MTDAPILDPDHSVHEIMDRWPETVHVFLAFKMLCVGCAVAPFHTIEEACKEHNIDPKSVKTALLWAVTPRGKDGGTDQAEIS